MKYKIKNEKGQQIIEGVQSYRVINVSSTIAGFGDISLQPQEAASLNISISHKQKLENEGIASFTIVKPYDTTLPSGEYTAYLDTPIYSGHSVGFEIYPDKNKIYDPGVYVYVPNSGQITVLTSIDTVQTYVIKNAGCVLPVKCKAILPENTTIQTVIAFGVGIPVDKDIVPPVLPDPDTGSVPDDGSNIAYILKQQVLLPYGFI